MERMVFGEWVLDVDMEATKAYYENLQVPAVETQAYRNFKAYCVQMTPEEKEFFTSLGIVPECCEVFSMRMDKACNYYYGGTYSIVGKYIHKPQVVLQAVEESDEVPDNSLNIGKFNFDFLDPDIPIWPIPSDSPFIFIMFNIEHVPWMLDEKCEEVYIEPPQWWQLIKKYKFHKQTKEFEKNSAIAYKQELQDQFLQVFEAKSIQYRKLSDKEISDFVSRWFESFIPEDKRAKARQICFPNRKWGNYLWHAFSYELVPCEEADSAREKYDHLERNKCYLYIDNEGVGFEIENGSAFSALDADGFPDLLITGQDFNWTYVHTHEEYCGPYFKTRE